MCIVSKKIEPDTDGSKKARSGEDSSKKDAEKKNGSVRK